MRCYWYPLSLVAHDSTLVIRNGCDPDQARWKSIRPGLWFAVPTMILQGAKQRRIEWAGIAHRDILPHVIQFSHTDNDCAHCGIREDKAQGHLRQSQ